jgi:outer membrane lipoprotein-sorting protein
VEVTVSRDGATQRFDGVMLLKAPASLRFEALSPFGTPFLFLVASGREFTFYNVVENRAVVGTDSAEGVKRLLGLPFTTEELVGLLAGYVLPLGNPETASLSPSDGLLTLSGLSWSQRIWFSLESEIPHRVEFGGGRAPVRIDFEGGDASTPPSLITLTALDRPFEVLIRYRSAELGTGLLDGAFSLNLPARVRVQRVN